MIAKTILDDSRSEVMWGEPRYYGAHISIYKYSTEIIIPIYYRNLVLKARTLKYAIIKVGKFSIHLNLWTAAQIFLILDFLC